MIEILLAVTIIGVIVTIAAISQRGAQLKARDVKRVSDMKELQKAMTLYLTLAGGYPTYTGCIDQGGSDVVSSSLLSQGIVNSNSHLVDPLFPSDVDKCYYYEGTPTSYTLRYTLETNSTAGSAGDHLIRP